MLCRAKQIPAYTDSLYNLLGHDQTVEPLELPLTGLVILEDRGSPAH